jgi:hypothetical protein
MPAFLSSLAKTLVPSDITVYVSYALILAASIWRNFHSGLKWEGTSCCKILNMSEYLFTAGCEADVRIMTLGLHFMSGESSYDLHKGDNFFNFKMFPFNICTSNHVLARHVLVPVVLEVNRNIKDEINWRNIILT